MILIVFNKRHWQNQVIFANAFIQLLKSAKDITRRLAVLKKNSKKKEVIRMRLLDSFIRLLKPFDYLLFAALIVGSFLPVFSLPKLRNIQVIVTPLFESMGRRLIDSTSKK